MFEVISLETSPKLWYGTGVKNPQYLHIHYVAASAIHFVPGCVITGCPHSTLHPALSLVNPLRLYAHQGVLTIAQKGALASVGVPRTLPLESILPCPYQTSRCHCTHL